MSTICLNMIVKDEAEIIEDTLANILEHIALDYWVIADTGSTDDTPNRIQRFFDERGISGELLHHKWKHFGHNRQLAMDAAQGKSDYLLFFDADDRFYGNLKIVANTPLTASAYFFKMVNQYAKEHIYTRRLLIKNDGTYQWRGVVHEQLHTECNVHQTLVEGDYYVISGRFGARSHNPQKYYDDALLLEKYFDENDEPMLCSQNAYFCGQSYRDAGDHKKAAEWFEKSLTSYSDISTEIKRYVLMALAKEYVILKQPEKAVYQWLLAYDNSPNNAESLVHLSEHFCNQGAAQLAFDYAQRSLPLDLPKLAQSIAIDKTVYDYGRYNAYMRSAWVLNRYPETYWAIKKLLAQPELNTDLNESLLSIILQPSILSLVAKDEDTECMRSTNKLVYL